MKAITCSLWAGLALVCGAGATNADNAVNISANDGYPGSATNGWGSGWVERSIRAKITQVRSTDQSKLSGGEASHLEIIAKSVPDGSGEGAGGAVERNYHSAPDGVGLSKPVRYEFLFRPDQVSPDCRYTIFESNRSQANSGSNATWQISALGGFWRVMSGAGNGRQQEEIDTRIPLEEGKVYRFVVNADPATRKWSVEISGVGDAKTFSDLDFRTRDSVLGGNIHFGFSDSRPNDETSFQYSIGDIQISSGR